MPEPDGPQWLAALREAQGYLDAMWSDEDGMDYAEAEADHHGLGPLEGGEIAEGTSYEALQKFNARWEGQPLESLKSTPEVVPFVPPTMPPGADQTDDMNRDETGKLAGPRYEHPDPFGTNGTLEQ